MHQANFRTRSATALLLALCAAGCSVTRPTGRAAEATVAKMAERTAEVDVVLELTNPGTTEVELVNYDYMITLEDGSSYDGRWAALRALPPGQTIRATVPAVVPASSAHAGARWRVEGRMSYRDPQSFARILYEAGILRTEAAFAGEGTLAAPAK